MKQELSVSAHGRQYAIIADDEGLIGRKISGGEPYEAELLEHIYEQDYEGAALDVGAHIGNHSLWLAVVCGLRVTSFEPDPIARSDLWKNVELNELQGRIEVRSEALGANFNSASLAGKGRLHLGVNGGPVQVRPMDSLASHDVSVVKIDVEDMEPQVLRGGRRLLSEQGPDVYAEARDEEAHLRIGAEIADLGYEMKQRFSSRSVATPVEKWVRA